MAAIVYLDVDDEITSAASRIRILDDERIALVLPLGSRLATSRINFRLLAREGESRGKSVEIVTNDPSARALAASAGIRTYGTVAAFEAGPTAPGAEGAAAAPGPGDADAAEGEAFATAGASPTRAPSIDDSPTVAMPVIRPPRDLGVSPARVGRPIPRRRWPWVVGAAVVGAVLVGSGIAAFALLPSAHVTLIPASDTVGPIQLNVTAQVGVTEPDPVNLLLPARTFTFDLEASDTFPATGTKVTETKAEGTVTFANCDTGNAVTIFQGAIVSTESGVEFRTLDTITVKRGHFLSCETNNVDVQAVAAGEGGNVGSGAINQVPGSFDPETLKVANQQPTTGGSHTESTQVQQSDVDAALAALDEALTASFDEQLAGTTEVPEGTTLFEATKLRSEATPSVDPATLVGQEVAEFQLGMTAEGSIIGVDPAPVNQLAEARIRAAVDPGFQLVEGSIKVVPGTPIVAGTTITFPATVRAVEVKVVDGDAVLARIKGLGLPQARTVLAQYGQATIAVWPDWVTTIPTGDRATLEVGEPVLPGASPGASTTPGPGASGAAIPSASPGSAAP